MILNPGDQTRSRADGLRGRALGQAGLPLFNPSFAFHQPSCTILFRIGVQPIVGQQRQDGKQALSEEARSKQSSERLTLKSFSMSISVRWTKFKGNGFSTASKNQSKPEKESCG